MASSQAGVMASGGFLLGSSTAAILGAAGALAFSAVSIGIGFIFIAKYGYDYLHKKVKPKA